MNLMSLAGRDSLNPPWWPFFESKSPSTVKRRMIFERKGADTPMALERSSARILSKGLWRAI